MSDEAQAKRPALGRDPIAVARDNWVAAGWSEAADGMALVTSIMRIHQLVLTEAETALRAHELTFARFEVLMLLRFSTRGALPVGKIGERLQVHPASVTNAIQRLEASGLVKRAPNPADGRSVIASITPAGERVVDAAVVDLNRVFSGLAIAPSHQRAVFSSLQRWRQAYGDFRTP